MPIYEYLCNSCKETFSLLQSVNSKREDSKCPKCGSRNIEKSMSSFSCCIIGNNSGFDSSGLHASHTTG